MGRSEKLVAQLQEGAQRDHLRRHQDGTQAVAAHRGRLQRGELTPAGSRSSLRNLATDCLDLVQLHCPPVEAFYMPEVFGALDDLVRQGKIRHYGVSVEKVEEALKAIEFPGVQTIQIIFNAFRHRPAELFFEQAKKRQVGILARVPLASGLLTGKITPGDPVRRQRPPQLQPPRGEIRRGRNFLRSAAGGGLPGGRGTAAARSGGHDADAIRAALDPDVRRRHLRHSGGQAARASRGERRGIRFSAAQRRPDAGRRERSTTPTPSSRSTSAGSGGHGSIMPGGGPGGGGSSLPPGRQQ